MHEARPSNIRSVARRDALGIAAVLLLAAGHLVFFAVFDRRPPNDHDAFFAVSNLDRAREFRHASPAAKPRLLVRSLLDASERHPRLAQTWLIAFTGTFGWSRLNLRLANLPFLLLLVGGTWLAARELAGTRMALLAAALAATLPVIVHMSRKWFIHFHTAAVASVALGLAFMILRRTRGPKLRLWMAFGLVQGLRVHTHPVDLPDAALLYVTLSLALLPDLWRRTRPLWGTLKGLAVAGAVSVVLGLPFLARSAGRAGRGLEDYVHSSDRFLNLGGWQGWRLEGPEKIEYMLKVVLIDYQYLLMPPFLLLVVIPGVLSLPFALAAPGPRVESSFRRRAMAMLCVSLGVQLPLSLIVVGNGGFRADWIYLAPQAIVLLLGAVWTVGARLPWSPVLSWPATLWGLAVLGQGVATVVVPLAASFHGPDPMRYPEAYTAPHLIWFQRSEHGEVFNTHHFLLRTPSPGERLGELLADVDPARTHVVGIHDLQWESARPDAAGCAAPDPTDDTQWAWPRYDGVRLPDVTEFEARGLEVKYRYAPEDEPEVLTIVRLWHAIEGPEARGESSPCPRDAAARERVVAAARERVIQRFGTRSPAAYRTVLLDDRMQGMVGAAEPLVNPTPGYWNAALAFPGAR
jgi:hypothetical protein